jgi:acetate---CoA ligase (ADP-forming)
MSLDRLFNPASIAIVGASADPSSISGRPLRLLRQHAYGGAIYPINPKYTELQGVRVYPAIGAVPEPVDLAVLAVPAPVVPRLVGECAAAGVRFAVVLSSGFGEAGASGRRLQAQLLEATRGSGLRVVGPNCEGFYNTAGGVAVGFSPAIDHERGFTSGRPGPVAIVAQSGGQGFALFNRGLEAGLGFSVVISTGNEADLGWLDYAEYLVDDPATRVILGFVEGLRDARRLVAVARRAAAAGKPLVVAKIGRTEAGRRAATSHTGNLVGVDEAYSAAFRQLGVVRVDDVDEMLDVAAYFSHGRLPAGRRVGILTASGGAGAWLADACAARGLELPPVREDNQARVRSFIPSYGNTGNPVDITAQAVYDGGYERALGLLLRSGEFDALAAAVSLAGADHFRARLPELRRALDGATVPLVYYSYTSATPETLASLRELGVPCYPTPVRTARALAWAAWYAAFLHRADDVAVFGSPPWGKVHKVPRPQEGGDRKWVAAPDPLAFVADAGIRIARAEIAHSPAEAVAAFRRLETPVALKIHSPHLPHKSDVDGVRLALATEPAVRDAYADLLATVRRRAPSATIDGVLVQEMVADGVELILGTTRDPQLGRFVLVGLGGTAVEVLGDVVLRLAPVSAPEARAMLDELRGAALLRGVRGRPPADLDALVGALVRFSEHAARLPPSIAALEINPLLVLPRDRGVVAVDVRLELEDAHA